MGCGMIFVLCSFRKLMGIVALTVLIKPLKRAYTALADDPGNHSDPALRPLAMRPGHESMIWQSAGRAALILVHLTLCTGGVHNARLS